MTLDPSRAETAEVKRPAPVDRPRTPTRDRDGGVRYSALLAGLLLAGGVALLLLGWRDASKFGYLWGLAIGALGVLMLVFIALPRLMGFLRVLIAIVLAGAAVAAGVWLPNRALAKEFDGEGVRWSAQSMRSGGQDAYSDHEFVQRVLGRTAVLANRTSARVISLTDGREFGKIAADRDDTYSIAGERLLVIRRRIAMLYDDHGKPLWPNGIPAERGVASASGVTVLESDCQGATCTATAVSDDGTVRWRRPVDSTAAAYKRFPNVTTLPADNINLASGPPVLPTHAALPVPGQPAEWDFVDLVTGNPVHHARGEYAGSIDKALITVTKQPSDCATQIHTDEGGDKNLLVKCTFAKPWARGSQLVFQDGVDAVAMRLGERGAIGEQVRLRDVALAQGDRRQHEMSEDGLASRDGGLVIGYPELSYRGGWKFVAESDRVSLDVGNRTVAVQANLRRTNPFDPVSGYVPDVEFAETDVRITVLDQLTGAVTGSVRAHEVGSIEPVRPGTALVVADGKIMLVGRHIS
ncbi:hypothetical protein EV193_101395 [Herbihabitans rhizosphaerae]|uniref:Uncharacterized protein n=1 Tax=Herbihabitans rhizosphaerae TaxID=1872711 RepID=A0A4Q7L4G4_9PSEU|nr:hypothetical protein [Herbihabitans rhizosphaerae]RZS44519.1 hypothetical protein EV193_101395 [Herbihabitans rhizosphaerae]